jgi:lipoate-protein ligase B
MYKDEIFDLGLIEYKKAWDFQKEIFQKIKNCSLRSGFIICSHYPVITLGRNAKKGSLKFSEADILGKGVEILPVDRGGDVTYHGPGQITVYPICQLSYFRRDLHYFLRCLEDFMIGVLSEFNVVSVKRPGLTGVWVKNKKISSLGIAVRNWISYHGLSVNVKKDDLEGFSLIRPCGMDIEMTSMESVVDSDISLEQVNKVISRRWKNDQSRFA